MDKYAVSSDDKRGALNRLTMPDFKRGGLNGFRGYLNVTTRDDTRRVCSKYELRAVNTSYHT
jgi:hypothetical protein